MEHRVNLPFSREKGGGRMQQFLYQSDVINGILQEMGRRAVGESCRHLRDSAPPLTHLGPVAD